MKVVFSAEAKANLRAIARYIARDNKARSISFTLELRAKSLNLAHMPRAFPLITPEHLGIRRRVHGNYHIFYRIEQDRITIIQILHGAQDIDSNLLPGH